MTSPRAGERARPPGEARQLGRRKRAWKSHSCVQGFPWGSPGVGDNATHLRRLFSSHASLRIHALSSNYNEPPQMQVRPQTFGELLFQVALDFQFCNCVPPLFLNKVIDVVQRSFLKFWAWGWGARVTAPGLAALPVPLATNAGVHVTDTLNQPQRSEHVQWVDAAYLCTRARVQVPHRGPPLHLGLRPGTSSHSTMRGGSCISGNRFLPFFWCRVLQCDVIGRPVRPPQCWPRCL